jgi:oxepin-CoA hydrolase/3-oxo-5,6-dehydrosuberyl-CoA semialdehyde dehydrogenase
MTFHRVESFVAGQWIGPGSAARPIESAITGAVIGEAGGAAPDTGLMLDYAHTVGGPGLRTAGFHDRARMLKALAQYLDARKDGLYALSFDTGATRADQRIDIDGGIGTLFVYAAKGRREMPDGDVYLDGPVEQLSRGGSFLGQHVCTPLTGAAIQINAFNFPVWGMLEKLAPAFLAGVPAIVKPATATCQVTEAAIRLMLDADILPDGAIQLIAGGTGDLLDLLGAQDLVSFTGSAETAIRLRATPNLLENGTRFIAEQDSLNASILGPDAAPGTPEFDLFVAEAHREMTAKAGQKCTAIRRMLVPEPVVEPFQAALAARLRDTVIGDPRRDDVAMGPLVSRAQRADVLDKAARIGAEATRLLGDPDAFVARGADAAAGGFVPPMLFLCADPDGAAAVHGTEAFGPVATVLPYRDLDHAIALGNRGQGSLALSLFTRDPDTARQVALGAGAWHGRLYINNRDAAAEATGHGAPLPHMIHGGPGRAGGGEELGGVRAVLHHMQRMAVQGSPDMLAAIGGRWVPGAAETEGPAHPFRRGFGALQIGETLWSEPRDVTLADIEHFAEFTGDRFYAHMDEDAAAANPFFPGRVAHGYLLLAFAAGLFVDPDPGPVLANTGLDNLRFQKPVRPGDAIRVRLTVKAKTRRTDAYGEVRWHVTLVNQAGETVADYDLMTMNANGH